MKQLLPQAEYEPFLASYREAPVRGLFLNTLKGDFAKLSNASHFSLTPVPFAPGGYSYEEADRPGKHVLHEAGAYYIQEPSAMLPALLLDAKPGELILDLCAAPGGKTVQLASAMQGKGLLVSNEIHPNRAKILSENVERMGIRNCIVLNASPDTLAERLPGFFDKILVDAPCSGEGMFRKNPESVSEWSPENVRLCAARQDKILDAAVKMLRSDGTILYSTCTFNAEEDEGTVDRFLKRYPDFSLLRSEKLMPHRVSGEGQFAAVLSQGKVAALPAARRSESTYALSGSKASLPSDLSALLRAELSSDRLLPFGDHLYLLPEVSFSLKGLKVLRPGLHLGSFEGRKKDRFLPSHSLALSLSENEVTSHVALTKEEAASYITGNTLPCNAENGWVLLTVDGYSLGFGKVVNHIMKNHYPKGLRKQL